MDSSKDIASGNSQAIQLPITMDDPWRAFEESLSEFSKDFLADGRNKPDQQTRDGL